MIYKAPTSIKNQGAVLTFRSKFVQFYSVKCADVNLLCYTGAKYHIVITRKLNLFLWKSIKLLPPELLLLAQICTKSFVGWDFAPDPTGRAYSAPPDPLAGLRGPTSNGKGGKGRGGKGGEGRGRDGVPVKFWLGIHPWISSIFQCLSRQFLN